MIEVKNTVVVLNITSSALFKSATQACWLFSAVTLSGRVAPSIGLRGSVSV